MFVATPIHRSLKNPSTGIDISVPAVLEVEAPLGGTTTEYEIAVFTNLPSYKTDLHKEEDVVHFTVQKAYREVEDFYDKIAKRFNGLSLPSIPRGRSVLQCSSEEKRKSLDQLMKHASCTQEICHSTIFQHFIGINRLKKQSVANVTSSAHANPDTLSEDSLQTTENIPENQDSSPCDVNENDHLNSESSISELFPKMKVRKSSQSKEDSGIVDTALLINEKTNASEELDLFEEDKQIKEVKNKEMQLFQSDKNAHHGLFDCSEEDINLFGINSRTPAKNIASTNGKPKPMSQTVKETKQKYENKVSNSTNESEEVFSSKKEETRKSPDSFSEKYVLDSNGNSAGNTFLFGEQDFGSGITKEDAQLFYIPKSERKKCNANPFLSPSSDSTEENDIEESIEELTSLIEPSASLAPKHEEMKKVPKHPPRAAEGGSSTSPVRARRESFPKPPLPPKPSVPPKPKPATKPPVPAKKPSNQPQKKAPSISPIDIMQYIEQEEKLASAETSLFD